MSAEGPSNPLGDRPRMAEALASLKEGLRDSADPLYDSWKLRPRSPEPEHAPGQPAAPVARPPHARSGNANGDAGETIDIALDGTPDETSAADGESEATSLAGSVEEGLPTEELLIEVADFDAAPAAPAAPAALPIVSVQTDTVRVRIIRYQPFPRWALVVAAALLVFAGSLVVLRAKFPRESTRSTRSVLASQVPTAPPASNENRPAFSAPNPGVAEPAGSAATESEPGSAAPMPNKSSSGAAPATAPTGKLPSSPPRRRPGSHDFFRDPGF